MNTICARWPNYTRLVLIVKSFCARIVYFLLCTKCALLGLTSCTLCV
nr:MAG TPA: hypothetical protein [Caudoviricetes sp.]